MNCSQCNSDGNNNNWTVIAVVSPPEDAVIESLLQSFGIPVRLVHEAIGTVFGLSVGPLGQIEVAVPESYADEALQLLDAELEE